MLTRSRIVSAALALLLAMPLIPADVALAANVNTMPSSLAVCVNGTGTFTAMHGSNTINALSGNTAVATVSPASAPSGSTFTVTGHSVGSTQINLTDTASGTGTEPITVTGPISVTSGNTLTFDGTLSDGSGAASQKFTVSDPTPSGVSATVTATLPSSPAIASFSSTSTVLTASQATANGQAQFTVFPVGSSSGNSANTSIALKDSSGCTLPNAVSITVIPGTLSLSASSLSFTALGSGNNQVFTAQDYNYTGTLSASSSSTGVATVSPVSTPAPGAAKSVTYTVTPVNFGKSTVTVTGTGPSQAVSVLVSGGTIGISGSKTAAFGTINDNTNQYLPASAIHVTGSVETTANGGANVYVLSPGDIIGSSGDVLKISYLTYSCTSNDTSKNQGGTFSTGFLQLIANTAAANCLTFGNAGGTGQYADLDLNVNLFLDDRTLPADTYSTATGRNNPFQVVLSAT